MPRAIRNPEEIEAVKEGILQTAMAIICEEGFNQLSMRKLATRLKMTAANIYNYYSNKDEIYLGIQTKGFAMLFESFQEVYQGQKEPEERIRSMIRAYLDFGMNNPDYYEVMLNRNTPKYADYVGTKLEPVARIEKNTALQIADITTKILSETFGNAITLEEARFRTIQVWTALHGVVSLYNNRVLQEMGEDLDTVIERIVGDMLLPIKTLI